MSRQQQPTVNPLHNPLSHTSSHHHHQVSGLDAVNFPANTEGGPQRTDEYTIETAQGWIAPDEEQETHASPTPTVVGSGSAEKPGPGGLVMTLGEREKGLVVKLVTFTEGDKEDPRGWSVRTKW